MQTQIQVSYWSIIIYWYTLQSLWSRIMSVGSVSRKGICSQKITRRTIVQHFATTLFKIRFYIWIGQEWWCNRVHFQFKLVLPSKCVNRVVCIKVSLSSYLLLYDCSSIKTGVIVGCFFNVAMPCTLTGAHLTKWFVFHCKHFVIS